VAGTSADVPAHLALETQRRSERLHLGTIYESEQADFTFDAVGNTVSRCAKVK
jgi:hypothetical protein